MVILNKSPCDTAKKRPMSEPSFEFHCGSAAVRWKPSLSKLKFNYDYVTENVDCSCVCEDLKKKNRLFTLFLDSLGPFSLELVFALLSASLNLRLTPDLMASSEDGSSSESPSEKRAALRLDF